MSWVIWELLFRLFECRIGFFLQFEFLNFWSFMHAFFTCIFSPLELVLFHDSMLIVSWLLTFLLRLRLFFKASASTSSAIKPVRRLKYRLSPKGRRTWGQENRSVRICPVWAVSALYVSFESFLSIDDLKLINDGQVSCAMSSEVIEDYRR